MRSHASVGHGVPEAGLYAHAGHALHGLHGLVLHGHRNAVANGITQIADANIARRRNLVDKVTQGPGTVQLHKGVVSPASLHSAEVELGASLVICGNGRRVGHPHLCQNLGNHLTLTHGVSLHIERVYGNAEEHGRLMGLCLNLLCWLWCLGATTKKCPNDRCDRCCTHACQPFHTRHSFICVHLLVGPLCLARLFPVSLFPIKIVCGVGHSTSFRVLFFG